MKDSFKDLTLKELLTRREDMKKDYRNLRFDAVVGHVDNPLKLKELRRKIARLHTIIHEYELGIRGEADATE
jgi:large subunit ribosomal protein L29